MASNQTANFGLNQWEATDKVLREEFNADNAKIDAALRELSAKSIQLGTYTGNGTAINLNLGFQPMVLFITCQHSGSSSASDIMCVLAFNDCVFQFSRSYGCTIYNHCQLTDTGFAVTEGSSIGMNGKGNTYNYAAFR